MKNDRNCTAQKCQQQQKSRMKNENGHTFIRNEDLHSAIKEQSQAMFHYHMIKMGDLHTLL